VRQSLKSSNSPENLLRRNLFPLASKPGGSMVAGGFAPPGGLAFGKGQSLGLGMVPPGLAPLGKGKGYPDLGGMGKGKGVFPGMQRGGLSSPATGAYCTASRFINALVQIILV